MNKIEKTHLYDLWREVPQEAQKEFTTGSFKGTDINPQWRIQMLTEVFGPCGIGWYYNIDKQWREEVGGMVFVYCNVSLYIKYDGEWSKPIQGTGGNWEMREFKDGKRVSDECYKMALTDALSIACKALGIGADIWFAKGASKYTMNEAECLLISQLAANDSTSSELKKKIDDAYLVVDAMKDPAALLAYIKDEKRGAQYLPGAAAKDASDSELALRNAFRNYALGKYDQINKK